jgi:AcrR family transcriptional regulator
MDNTTTQAPEPPEGLSSRDRILWAAASMLGEGAASSLSVRGVAARARVSTGSLRHHFPTQRDLMAAVLPLVYDLVLPVDSIKDSTIPARERLIAYLQNQIAPEGADLDLREAWLLAFDRYARTVPTPAVREEYLAIEREMRRRIEFALMVLEDEGALAAGETDGRARYLATVLNGLSVARAFPVDETFLQVELDVLGRAVDSLLDTVVAT